MNIKTIKETCIYVSDVDAAKSFYSDILGLQIITIVPGRHIFFKVGRSVLLCFVAAATRRETELPPHGATGSIHLAFEVSPEDYQKTLLELKAKIPIVHEHVWKHGHRSFYFHDPDKNLLEIVEEGLWD